MRGYLLDTHVLIWFVQDNSKLDKNVKEDIEYYKGKFSISILSIMEIINLIQLNKISLGISIKELFTKLKEYEIHVITKFENELLILEKLAMISFHNKLHSDVVDRTLIATAISNKMTLISADSKFPAYCKYGLELLEISA